MTLLRLSNSIALIVALAFCSFQSMASTSAYVLRHGKVVGFDQRLVTLQLSSGKKIHVLREGRLGGDLHVGQEFDVPLTDAQIKNAGVK